MATVDRTKGEKSRNKEWGTKKKKKEAEARRAAAGFCVAKQKFPFPRFQPVFPSRKFFIASPPSN